MKSFTIHPGSALAGAAIVVLTAVLSAQQIVGHQAIEVTRIREPVHVAAHPRDYVRIDEGAPYTVPAGRMLVLTGLGHAGGPDMASGSTGVFINGAVVIKDQYFSSNGGTHATIHLPTGLVAGPGDVVEASGNASYKPLVFGYLVDA